MKQFDYVRPASIAEAIAAHSAPGAVYLGAGTNLLDLMKGDVMRPDRLVDISRLPGLDAIEMLDDGDLRVGALVRNADLAYHPQFSTKFPMVAGALLSGASAQLRNAATVGGNLLQRTRCRYFYDTASACNRREPGAGCDALKGENRLHAVLGWSRACIATHPSDFCVALAALDAVVEVEGANGRREVRLVDLHRLPRDKPEQETSLGPGELSLPCGCPGTRRPSHLTRVISSFASVPLTLLRLSRPPPRSTWTAARFAVLGFWVASRPSPGARSGPRRCSRARRQIAPLLSARP